MLDFNHVVDFDFNKHPFTFSAEENQTILKRRTKKEKENNSIQHNINNNLLQMYKKDMHSADNMEPMNSQNKGFSSSFSFTDFRHPKSYGIVPHKNLEGYSSFSMNGHFSLKLEDEIMSVRFDRPEKYVACGHNNGNLTVVSLESQSSYRVFNTSLRKNPVTCLR